MLDYRGFDYLKFLGIAMDGGGIQPPSPWLKTFNRPFLLQTIIQQNYMAASTHNKTESTSSPGSSSADGQSSTNNPEYLIHYDAVLMMDSTQIIANMDWDPFRFLYTDGLTNNNNNYNTDTTPSPSLNSSILLAWGNVVPTTTNTNTHSIVWELKDFSSTPTKVSNVMLWNMNHPNITRIANLWMQKSQGHVIDVTPLDSSLLLLDMLKQEYGSSGNGSSSYPLASIPLEMIDGLQASYIKEDLDHFDKNHRVIVEGDLPVLIPTLSGIADSVCYRFYPQCELI
jgi:hypothetical protein